MDLYLSEIFNTITSFPGNLTYHLIVSFSIAGALYIAIQNWRISNFPQARRMVVGLSLLLGLRLAFFAASLLLIAFRTQTALFLPSIDRTVTALSLVVLVWLWAFPEPTRRWDTAFAILSCLLLVVSGITLVNWSIIYSNAVIQQTEVFFNESLQLNSLWEGISIGLVVFGLILLAWRRPNSWGIGAMMLLILGVGHLIHLVYPIVGLHFAGPVRLAQLAAYPMLLALPGRFVVPAKGSPDEAAPPLTVERRSYGTEAATFRAFMALVTEMEPEKLCIAYTRTVSHLMLADICLLIVLNDGDISFDCGYDLIREQSFPGATFSKEDLPLLASALERNKTLRLPASSTSPDLKSLNQSLETDRIGHLLAAPVPFSDGDPITGLVLLSPFSNRPWNTVDEDYLVELAAALSEIAHRNQVISASRASASPRTAGQPVDFDGASEFASVPNEQFETIQAWDRGEDPAGFTASAITAATLTELMTAQEHSQDTIAALEAEVDTLQHELDESTNAASMAIIAAEIRQPLQSIQEYADLLLSGDIGDVDKEEQRYLQRIRASADRIEAATSEILSSAAPAQNGAPLNGPANLYELIDEAIDFTRPQLREKNIAIRVDLPDELPELEVDREALQQILIFLLQNAGAATPLNGEIALLARPELEAEKESEILVQVTDTGGGISDDDLPRIFNRVAYIEGTGIDGVGEKGVGLAMAKNLVEAQQGKIWVDSRLGDGSTFNLLLPSHHPSTNGGPDHRSLE